MKLMKLVEILKYLDILVYFENGKKANENKPKKASCSRSSQKELKRGRREVLFQKCGWAGLTVKNR